MIVTINNATTNIIKNAINDMTNSTASNTNNKINNTTSMAARGGRSGVWEVLSQQRTLTAN